MINNLEFDHADIFANLKAIEDQFHQLIRRVPASGLIITNGQDDNIKTLLGRGIWSEQLTFAVTNADGPRPSNHLTIDQTSRLVVLNPRAHWRAALATERRSQPVECTGSYRRRSACRRPPETEYRLSCRLLRRQTADGNREDVAQGGPL